MEEIQTGDASPLQQAMRAFLLIKLNFEYCQVILCSWMVGNHNPSTGNRTDHNPLLFSIKCLDQTENWVFFQTLGTPVFYLYNSFTLPTYHLGCFGRRICVPFQSENFFFLSFFVEQIMNFLPLYKKKKSFIFFYLKNLCDEFPTSLFHMSLELFYCSVVLRYEVLVAPFVTTNTFKVC